VGDEPAEGPVEQERAPCPACGEMIVVSATICRFCRTDPRTPASATPSKSKFLDPKSNLVSCCTCPLLVVVGALVWWIAVNYGTGAWR
jgi:hypothetical protein